MKRKTVLFKISTWMLFIMLIFSGNVHALSDMQPTETRSVNAEYEYYLNHREEFNYGYVPPRAEFVLSRRRGVSDASLPSSYDARKNHLISPVKDQDMTGTCWAHAASSSVETAWKIQNGSFEDLSEMHLTYHAGTDTDLDTGGNALLAMGYYSRMDGPIDETAYATTQDVVVVNGKTILRGRTKMEDYGKKRAKFYVGGMIAISKSEIKRYVKDYGMVMAAYYSTVESMGYYTHEESRSQKNLGYHYPSKGTSNHAVSIVGWDDVRVIRNRRGQQSTGAFLVKNSWGTDFGEEGYFWVTYDSFSEDNNAYVFTDVGHPRDQIYHSEAYGWDGYSLIFSDSDPIYVVNEYLRQGVSAEETVEVALYKRGDERIRYTFWVGEPKNSSRDWKDYEYHELGQEVLDKGGYFTIPTRPVTLTEDRFVIKMKVEPLDGSNAMYCTTKSIRTDAGFLKSGYSFNGRYYHSDRDAATLSLLTNNVQTPILREIGQVTVAPVPVQKYTGEEIRPTVEAHDGSTALKEGVDYSLSYRNNIDPGRATIILSGMGDYTGTKEVFFEIEKPEAAKKSMEDTTADPIPVQEYTGREIRPEVRVYDGSTALKEGSDYNLSYENNVEPGRATVILSGMGDYTGTKEVFFEIEKPEAPKKSIRDTVADSISPKRYTGEEICPKVTVRDGHMVLTENVDYILTYENNIEVGTATIRVEGIGNYEGQKMVSFEIMPSENFPGYKEWEKQYDVSKDKEWTIRFSQPVAQESLTIARVYIVHEDNLNIPLMIQQKLSADGKVLVITPIQQYIRGGRYHLFIRDLYTRDGRRMKDNIWMTFTVRE